jgi:glycosyltransferase involved in cell wall biosynthesis
MTVLLLCGLHSDRALAIYKAVNQAATKWTRGLIAGFRENNVKVLGLTHCYEQLWPKGRFVSGTESDFDKTVELEWCRYLNVPGVKDWSLGIKYQVAIRKLIQENKIDAIVCYNVGHAYHLSAMRVAKQMGISCFPIILDGDDPRKDDWRWVLDGTKDADGVVFLSNWMIKNYPGKLPVLHMDGGCSAWFGDEAKAKTEKNLIVYSGGLDHWRGLDFLVEVIRELKNPDYRFIICGKCDRQAIYRKMGNDPRVEVKGFVSDEELHDVSLRASVFLNTRDPSIGDNVLNFPSKIPNCLAYGKPVVSTWTDSLDETYRAVLVSVDSVSAQTFSSAVDKTMMWSETERDQYSGKVKEWFCSHKLWSVQAKRLIDWMQQCQEGL